MQLVDAQAAAAVELGERGLKLAPKPTVRAVRAELQRIIASLGRAHCPYQASQLDRMGVRSSKQRRWVGDRRPVSPGGRPKSAVLPQNRSKKPPPKQVGNARHDRGRAGAQSGFPVFDGGASSVRPRGQIVQRGRRPASAPAARSIVPVDPAGRRLGGTFRLTLPARHTPLRSWLSKIGASDALTGLRLCGYSSVEEIAEARPGADDLKALGFGPGLRRKLLDGLQSHCSRSRRFAEI